MDQLLNRTTIIQMLTKMPIWATIGIEITESPNQEFVIFKMGNIVLQMLHDEILIFGAKKIVDALTTIGK
jgi:hypothetical protein